MLSYVSKAFTKVFGSRNDRLVKAYRRRVEQINALEPSVRKLNDAELRAKTDEFRQRFAKGERISDMQPEILAVAREAMDRAVGIRNIFNPDAHFDVSLLRPDVRPLYDGVVEQMKLLAPVEVTGSNDLVPAWQQVDIPNEIYEAVRAIYPRSRPPFRARPFDVQLIGGMVLSEGRISEMKTGEGKTIVAPLACYVACIESLQCHVVTVNDYLVQRDRDWVFPFYYHLGLTVGAIHPFHMQAGEKKQEAYHCDVVYGTNSEFGFDYLRDNMKLSTQEQVQKRRDFCIIDEVDSILIDEARTPLIISGPAHEDAPRYGLADTVARHLIVRQKEWNAANEQVQQAMMKIKGLEGDIRNARDKSAIPAMREQMKQRQDELPALEEARDRHVQYYELEREKKAAHLTHEGVAEAQKVAGIGSFYVGNNMDFPHLLENALRAHAVYQRDKDYVVQNGEVIIVDEFTGRLMIGRQWSDGLHQAVEAKENVKIKQETQTLATVTIQNYFKLYKRLAGMTGTAITEATEFDEIYKLDVVCVPTNVPVIRDDRDDLIFLSGKDKWSAILDEIKRFHDIGRPVLVGTTSVENSEMLSGLLSKRHGIRHEVLNAKQHEREAHIVENAGALGAVMIATNMAGRGTDIKLQPIDRASLLRHWQQRDLLPAAAKPADTDDRLVELAYRHLAQTQLGMKASEAEAEAVDDLKLALMRHWVATQSMADPAKAPTMSAEQCQKALDATPGFVLHKLRVFTHAEELGGLHIVGTERHEARRIDNQLRGRAGRQGDRGSSRFFISLEDDLMQMFAGKTTLTALSKLGMKEGDAIEHKWLTGSVARAQRKVEERNYQIRKNLLEYDEVMEYQRNAFYGIRQDVLEGRNIQQIIFDYIGESIVDAADTYLDRDYVPTQIAEWCRAELDVSIEPAKLRENDLPTLQNQVRAEARNEVKQTIDVTLGEYLSHDMPPEEWDYRGLASWAKTRFGVELREAELKKMNVDEIRTMLIEHALDLVDAKDLSGLEKFLAPLYAQKQLAEWVKQKFAFDVDPQAYAEKRGEKQGDYRKRVAGDLLERARAAYRQREVSYPVEFALDTVFQAARQDGKWAAEQLIGWARQRYGIEWTTDEVVKLTAHDLHEKLTAAGQGLLHGGRLEAQVDEAIAALGDDPHKVAAWTLQRFLQQLDPAELAAMDAPARKRAVIDAGRKLLRSELTQLERFVLLQILDTSWKDHLYAMDQLKDSVGLRAYAEQDPRIIYKREGASLFVQMQKTVRDRVTELIFRARLTPNVEVRNVYNNQQAEHAEAGSAVQQASQQAARGSDQQREDLDAAERAGAAAGAPMSRKQRRAAAADERHGEKSRQFKERKKRK